MIYNKTKLLNFLLKFHLFMFVDFEAKFEQDVRSFNLQKNTIIGARLEWATVTWAAKIFDVSNSTVSVLENKRPVTHRLET